jgi:hypothetical protein
MLASNSRRVVVDANGRVVFHLLAMASLRVGACGVKASHLYGDVQLAVVYLGAACPKPLVRVHVVRSLGLDRVLTGVVDRSADQVYDPLTVLRKGR